MVFLAEQQLHVLGHTVHAVLDAMSFTCGAGDLDAAVDDFVAIFVDDIFGLQSEEKEEIKIKSKWREARSTQSYDSFGLLSRVLAPKSFYNLMEPIKDLMATTESASVSLFVMGIKSGHVL